MDRPIPVLLVPTIPDIGASADGVLTLPLTPKMLDWIDLCRNRMRELRREISTADRLLIKVFESRWLSVHQPNDVDVPQTFIDVYASQFPDIIDNQAIANLEAFDDQFAYLEFTPRQLYLMPPTTIIRGNKEVPCYGLSSLVPMRFLRWAKLYWAEDPEIPNLFTSIARSDSRQALSILKNGLGVPESRPPFVRDIRRCLTEQELLPLLTCGDRFVRESTMRILAEPQEQTTNRSRNRGSAKKRL